MFSIAVLVITTESALPAAATSSASACDLSNHCFATARWENTPDTHGSSGTINFHCLYIDNTSSKFVNEEMWQGTDNSGLGNYWVEVGGRYGWPKGNSRYWFWADNRPNGGGYFQHYPGGAISLDTPYALSFEYDGNNNWLVFGPSFSETSTSNPPNGNYLESGTEITDNSARSVGNTRYLAWVDTSGTSQGDWSGAKLVNIGGFATPSWVGSDNSNISWSTPC